MDLFEAAYLTRGNTPPKLARRYRSLCDALLWPAPTTRVDCLYTMGIHARAMGFATDDLLKSLLRVLIYMGDHARWHHVH